MTPGDDIGHLPITFQGGRDMKPGDPASQYGSELALLLDEMNAWLDARDLTTRLQPESPLAGTAPDVQFGCERPGDDECEGYEEHQQMRLAVGRPSTSWTESARAEMARGGARRVLVITLEIGNYMPHQRDWKGSKEVRLGTDRTVDLPWLTSLRQPVSVLQLTGALMDADGRAIRIGAEGLLARPTNVALAGFGVQRVIGDEDVKRVRENPEVWQTALSHMLAQLTGTRLAANS